MKAIRTKAAGRGFTLIEVVVSMTILVTVLMICYRILGDTLEVSETIDRKTRPDKVGEAIMALLRRDIQGTLWYRMGDKIFLGEDMGEGESSHDELHFYTSSKPIYSLPQDTQDNMGPAWAGITSVSYVLQNSQKFEGCYTLFRRESVEITEDEPFTKGSYFEVYDKVKYLDIHYFDGYEWVPEWDSAQRQEQYQEELDAAAQGLVDDSKQIKSGSSTASSKSSTVESKTKIPSSRSSSTGGSNTGNLPSNTAGANSLYPDEEGVDVLPLPDHGIPHAIRIELGIAVGSERGLYRENMEIDSPVKVYKYSATITIPSATVTRVSADVSESMGDSMGDLTSAALGSGSAAGGPQPMGPGGISNQNPLGKGGRGDRGQNAGSFGRGGRTRPSVNGVRSNGRPAPGGRNSFGGGFKTSGGGRRR